MLLFVFQVDATMGSAMMEDPGKVSIQALEKSAEDEDKNVVEVIPDFKDKDKEACSRKRGPNQMEPAVSCLASDVYYLRMFVMR